MAEIYFRHESLRKQQEDLIKDAYSAIENKDHLLAHAVTGTGKTDALISPAISYALENNKTVFFLTPKISQHRIAMDVVRSLAKKYELDLRAVDFIGRKYACVDPALSEQDSEGFYQSCERKRKKEQCEFYRNAKGFSRLEEAKADRLFKSMEKRYGCGMHHTELVEIGKEKQACPYEWLTKLASISNVIVADYFHLMLPQIRDIFLLKTKKKLSNSIIIVDEAHNLAKRVRDQLSVSTNTFLQKKLDKELRALGLKSNFENKFNRWAKHELGKAREKLVSREEYFNALSNEEYTPEELADYLESCGQAFLEATGKKSFCLRFAKFLQLWMDENKIPSVRILRRKGESYFLSRKALDPSSATSKMNDAHCAILTSGTLLPLEMHRDVLGLDPERTKMKQYSSPFSKKNKLNMILEGFTTRYSQRHPEQYKKMSEMLDKIIASTPGGTALFFPSYKVMDAVIPFMKSRSLLLQRERMNPTEIGDLLKRFQERGTLCCVQGGSLSVDYQEPIILRKDGEVFIHEIGAFVDGIMNNSKVETTEGVDRSIPSEKYEVCAFDPNTFKMSFKPISKVIRHKTNEPLLEISLQTGRKIKATPSHSIFVLKNGAVCAPKASELTEGDFVLIPKQVPSGKIPKELNIIDEMLGLPDSKVSNIYLRGVGTNLDLQKLKKAGYPRFWKYRDTIPLNLLKKDVWTERPNVDKLHVRWGNDIRTKIPLSHEFFRLLGYYVAEGHHVRGRHSCAGLTFGLHEKELIEDAAACVYSIFGRSASVQYADHFARLTFGGKFAKLFFVDILGCGERAGNKRVPSLVLSAPREAKLEFLKGYFAGDGTASKVSEISFKTISKMLASDILYLFLQLGLFAGCTEIPAKGNNKKAYYIYLTNSSQFKHLLPMFNQADLRTISKHIASSETNKKRRTMLPSSIPVTESGLHELSLEANAHANANNVNCRARLYNNTLRRDLFEETFDYILTEKRNELAQHKIAFIRKLISSDFAFAKIKKIKKVPASSEYVYDVSVEGFENFVGGFGGAILHNSEGIDYNQEEIKTAVIVGIALDEMSLEVESLIDHYDEKFGQGWNYGYLYPGVTKAIQSAGRAIRKETDRAVLIYMDERFKWKNYSAMLPKDERFVLTADPLPYMDKFWD